MLGRAALALAVGCTLGIAAAQQEAATDHSPRALADGVARIREELMWAAGHVAPEENEAGRRRLKSCGLIPSSFAEISTQLSYADEYPIPKSFYKKEGVVGILTAFLGEFVEAVTVLEGVYGVRDIANHRYVAGVLDGIDVVLVTTGIATTNAAITVQSMFIAWPLIEYVVFSGIAGGTNDGNQIADVIVPKVWVHPQSSKFVRPLPTYSGFGTTKKFYDFGVDFPVKFATTPEGGFYSFLRPNCIGCKKPARSKDVKAFKSLGATVVPNFAIMIELETFTSPLDAFQAVPPSKAFYEVPSIFIDIVEQIIAEGAVQFVRNATDPLTGNLLTFDPQLKVGVSGISADTFLDNADYRQSMYDSFGAEVVDMESAAVMHTCEENGKKCLAIRSLSDKAGGEGKLNSILSFISIAGRNSVAVLREVVKRVPGASKSNC